MDNSFHNTLLQNGNHQPAQWSDRLNKPPIRHEEEV